MSVHVTNLVWRHSEHKGSALLVLLALADNADDDGNAFPGVAHIARKTRLSRRQVLNLLKELAAGDELVKVQRGGRRGPSGRTNLYRIQVQTLHLRPDRVHVQDAGSQGAMGCTEGVQPVAPKPLGEPSDREPSSSRATRESEDHHDDPLAVFDDDAGVCPHKLLDAFNAHAGTGYELDAYRRRIVARLDEHPDLTESEHLAIIDAVFEGPKWWGDRPLPGIIYGSAELFERAVERWRLAESPPSLPRQTPAPSDPPAKDAEKAWQEIINALRGEMSGAAIALQFGDLRPVAVQADGRLVMAGPTAEFVRRRYGPRLSECAESLGYAGALLRQEASKR